MSRSALLAACLACLVIAAMPSAAAAEPERTVVRSQAELPAYSYPLSKKPSELLEDTAAFDAFAAQVRSDLETLLADYDIQDRSTLSAAYATLRSLALLRGDADAALDYSARIRDLEEKPGARMASGLRQNAAAAAIRAGDDPVTRGAAIRRHFDKALADMHWNVAQNEIRSMKGFIELAGDAYLVGLVQSRLDPVLAENGALSRDNASLLINVRMQRGLLAPHADEQIAALAAYIQTHDTPKEDIWAARSVSLDGRDGLTPVVIGIWDSGADIDLFRRQLHVNPRERANGLDDDGNGFIDDVHGIAYDIDMQKQMDLLYPLTPEQTRHEGEMRLHTKGVLDMQANVDSAEARMVRGLFGSMHPDDLGPFLEGLSLYGNYAHGTHVTGIAVDGNPAARVLTVRTTSSHELKPRPVTREYATKMAAADREIVDYLKGQGVRVVNMSWGGGPEWVEQTLEANGLGGTPEQRRAEALAIFEIISGSLTDAIRSAPGILFVPGAGNGDEDVDFAQFIPAGIDLPNVLTVGGVDRAGDEVGFTSYGRRVRVHANGYEVDSVVPGGERIRWSGTSMAAPQVANLAAKLWALDPSLTVADVVQLILDGAERSDVGRRNLIHPRRSIVRLAAR